MSNEYNFADMNRYSSSGTNGMSSDTFSGTQKRTRKDKFRDALKAATKYKDRTDYKAKREADAKEDAAASRATMKIAPDISVMEGYTDPGFVLQGQEGTRGKILGGIGSAVGGYFGGPLGGQVGGMIGSSFG